MAWIQINDEECPGCQRKGDEGQRVDGKCWRCNLPDRLDPVEHAKLRDKLEWECDNLRETMADINSMTDHTFRSSYGESKAYARPIVERMLKRNAADLETLGTDGWICSGCGEPLEPSESGVPRETEEHFGMRFDLGACCHPECTVENPQLRLSEENAHV